MAECSGMPKLFALSWFFIWMLHFAQKSEGSVVASSTDPFRSVRVIGPKFNYVDNSSSMQAPSTSGNPPTESPMVSHVTAANLTVLNTSDFLWNQIFESKPALWKGFAVPTWENATNSPEHLYDGIVTSTTVPPPPTRIPMTTAKPSTTAGSHYPKIWVAVADSEPSKPVITKTEKIQPRPYFNHNTPMSSEYSGPHADAPPARNKGSVVPKLAPYNDRMSGMAVGKSYGGGSSPMMMSGGSYGGMSHGGGSGGGGGSAGYYGSMMNTGSGGGGSGSYGNMMHTGSGGGSGSYGNMMHTGSGGGSGSYGSMMSGSGGYDGSHSHNYGSMHGGGGGGMMGYGSHGGGNGYSAGYSMGKEDLGIKSIFSKLLALLPVGLLLAVALPSLVVIPSRRSLSETTDKKVTEAYPILDMINYYGVKSLQDESCFRHLICKTVRMGSEDGSNVFQRQLWTVANWVDEGMMQNLGISDLWSRIIKDQCFEYKCQKKSVQTTSDSDKND